MTLFRRRAGALALVGLASWFVGKAQATPSPVPLRPPDPICVAGLCGEIRWDFEDHNHDGLGDLQGWTGSGTMFRDSAGVLRQPTYQANVSLRRIVQSTAPSEPSQFRSLRPLLDLGGDYWNVGWPTGYQGDFWIGTSESRPGASVPYDSVAGEAAVGELVSPTFRLQKSFIRFLASGTCSANVSVQLEELATRRAVVDDCSTQTAAADGAHSVSEHSCPGPRCADAIARDRLAENALTSCMSAATTVRLVEVASPTWEPVRVFRGFRANDPHQPIYTEYRYTPVGSCSEVMTRINWSTQPISSRGETAAYRVRIIDSAANGHINADDFWITDSTSDPDPSVPLFGFADLHTHPAAHLAYGGLLIAGTPAGVVAGGSDQPGRTQAKPRSDSDFWDDLNLGCHAYRTTPPVHPCHDTAGYGLHCNGAAAPQVINLFTVGSREPTTGPAQRTVGHFARAGLSAPSWLNASHQMMHINWLRRAYEGGLRLLVADAVNNRTASWLLLDNPGTPPLTDTDVIRRQFAYITALVRANASWMEIALSPPHARRIINSGKLAVVLGTEVDAFGECNEVTSYIREAGSVVPITTRCDLPTVMARLDELYHLGQRKMNPIHLADNGFGGMAVYSDVFVMSSNWYNRGDFYNFCGDPRVPQSFCPYTTTLARDPDNHYSADVIHRCIPANQLEPPNHLGGSGTSLLDYATCTRGLLGWPQLRDATTLLGSQGYHLSSALSYATISNNPFPGVSAQGCVGASWCQAVANMTIHLPGYGDTQADMNAVGLNENGRALLREMMRRGMLIDVQHMSERAVNEVLGLVDSTLGIIPGPAGHAGSAIVAPKKNKCGRMSVAQFDAHPACRDIFYPVMSSHTGLRLSVGERGPDGAMLSTPDDLPAGQSENSRSLTQLQRIYQIGGMLGLGTVGGTTAMLAAYQTLQRTLGNLAVAVGSDLNGGDAGAPPRLTAWSCVDGPLPDAHQGLVRYQTAPGASAPVYREAACSGPQTVTFQPTNPDQPPLKPLTLPGNGQPLDINTDGFANVGMYPDYFQDLRAMNVNRSTLAPLLQSAERFVTMWEASCRVAEATPGANSAAACRCDPGVQSARQFCPQESPGM